MKKSIQEAMNNWVLQNYSIFADYMHEQNSLFFAWKQLRSCTAWVAETDCYFILKSYDTIAAIIDKYTGQKFDFLRYVYGYTSTSAQHISKFFSDYGDFRIMPYTYREI